MVMKRQYQQLIRDYLNYFPCVVLVGARQTGKSTLIEMVAGEREVFDLEARADYSQVASDPDLFLRLNDNPIAIDEAQLLPELFPALRVAIDRDRRAYGKYLVSGSSSPDLLNAISESLAGRVGIIELAPFSFSETREIDSPNLLSLFGGDMEAGNILRQWPAASTDRADEAIARYWFRGGYGCEGCFDSRCG